MKKKTHCFLLVAFIMQAGMANLVPAEQPPHSVRRLALIAGANNGGSHREKLRYAVTDAKALLGIFEELGSTAADDSRLLVEPGREAFLWEMDRLREKIQRLQKDNQKVEVILYYSGHADEYNLLLGNEKVSYREIQKVIYDLQADVCITILDCCASGSFIRLKGSKKTAPFLFDSVNDMKGYAVMTSSSADESSQESDIILGSFFSHYLISGLRGAADNNQDGKVTLSEAYQFAYKETLANTISTINGPQHPNYNIQMAGTGDVVLTDILKSSVILSFAKELQGLFFIHNQKDALIAELRKNDDATLEYGLNKGKYRIVQVQGQEVREIQLEMPAQGRLELKDSHFKTIRKTNAVARGDWRISRQGMFASKNRLNLFAGLSTKVAYLDGRWSLLPGILMGVGNEQFSFGLQGINRLKKNSVYPSYWSVFAEHRLFRYYSLDLSAGLFAGMGYRDKNEEHTSPWESAAEPAPFFIIEPKLSCSFRISANLRFHTGLSMAFFTKKVGDVNALSLTLGLIFSGGNN